MTLSLVGICLLPAVWLPRADATSERVDAEPSSSAGACAPGSPIDSTTVVRCSADGRYRVSAAIGRSGDGVITVELAAEAGWRELFTGPTCVSGVAGVTADQLLKLGVPVGTSDELGDPPDVCGPMGGLW